MGSNRNLIKQTHDNANIQYTPVKIDHTVTRKQKVYLTMTNHQMTKIEPDTIFI